MRNFILLLVLISGILSGYLIGDYRGKDAREALQKAIATGKTLDTERAAAITQLKTELDTLDDKHRRELETLRKDNAVKIAEWRHNKDTLEEKIKRNTAQLSESDTRLKSLAAQHDGTSGTEAAKLDLEIARLHKEREELRREIEGNACLQARIPHSVLDALNETKIAEKK